jgi:hypothetical protein
MQQSNENLCISLHFSLFFGLDGFVNPGAPAGARTQS